MKSGASPQPKPAATVILIRQRGPELQVYLLKRNVNSRFMAGNYVFPGGMLEPEDGYVDRWLTHVDLELTEIERHLGNGISGSAALAYGIAAIRETYEEAGIILAGNECRTADPPSVQIQPRTESFLSRVQSANWTLQLKALNRWSRWITPEQMHRRYDTRFFWAANPVDQVCRPDLEEVVHGRWISPCEALAANLSGEIPLSPPTLVTLHELLTYADLDDLKKRSLHRSWGESRLPRMVVKKDATLIFQPWDHQYDQDRVAINADALPESVLPVGHPFSRLWRCDGIWKPVSAHGA